MSYARALTTIGEHIEKAAGEDLSIGEVNGGFVVAYIAEQRQQAQLFRASELSSAKVTGRLPRPSGRARTRLQALGKHLDEDGASKILIHEDEDAYLTSYEIPLYDRTTGQPSGTERITRRFVSHAIFS